MNPAVFHNPTFKALGIGCLALLMLIPLLQVDGLISERQDLRRQALAQIAQGWGAQQTLGGPVLAIPKHVRIANDKASVTVEREEILLADALKIDGTLAVDKRHYGIYSAPVYSATLKLHTHFVASDFAALEKDDAQWQWQRAELRLPLSDVRGVRSVSVFSINGVDAHFHSGSESVADLTSIATSLDLSTLRSKDFDIDIEIVIAGTERFDILPLARSSEVNLAAPWPSPSFGGAFLPDKSDIDESHFSAHWQVLDINRSFGQHWEKSREGTQAFANASFGFALYQPASVYQQNVRAGKYGLLVITLTFIAVFLCEVLKRWRVHALQYLLVGVALATFYVVLLALSEQIGFKFAYLAAAIAVVAMIGGYIGAILGTWRAGWVLASLLTLIFALFYVLVVSEQYSLLMGALALLVAVAAMMFLTRRVDWYALSQRKPV
jgi:inner membrane protein